MLEKELVELFCLCRKVIRETKVCVEFELSSNMKYPTTMIRIRECGYDPAKEYDKIYMFYQEDESLKEIAMEDYKSATAYLTRLLEENGS